MRRCLLLLLLLTRAATAQLLSPLAKTPDWRELDRFQETMTREEFTRLLAEIYAPRDAARAFVAIGADAATIKVALPPEKSYTLRFAQPERERCPLQAWRPAAALGSAPKGKPLAGLKIAIDAGHLGGEWARLEERFFQLGESKPVQEGDLTLRVAKKLKPLLEAMGATVTLVRDSNTPVTKDRPESLRDLARTELHLEGHAKPRESYAGFNDPRRGGTVQFESELLFYRMSEIRQRARLVNDTIKPDLTLCLHFNAEAWGDPEHPEFVPRNHFHVIVNGCYSAAELKHDDVRFEMLYKLLSRSYAEERTAGQAVATSLAAASGLPPYRYFTPNAVAVPETEYLWARNLLANRLYRTPVVYLEPYVMNSELVWERVQLGDYEGTIEVGGEARKSIFREYAEGVAEGLRKYYAEQR